jgi:hypothetical protein
MSKFACQPDLAVIAVATKPGFKMRYMSAGLKMQENERIAGKGVDLRRFIADVEAMPIMRRF